MPDIEKINEFKKEILDNISDEKAKKEPFGIKMDIDPPREGEIIVPWEDKEDIVDLEEESDEELDLDSILGTLDSEEDQKSIANKSEILKNSNKVGVDPEFNDLDNDFDVLSSNLEDNLDKILDDNSISIDENVINLNLDNSDGLQNVDPGSDLNSNLRTSDKSLNSEIDDNDLEQDSIIDSNDDFDLDSMIGNLNEADETSNRIESLNNNENIFDENFNNLDLDEEGDFSNLSDDFEFLRDDNNKSFGNNHFKIDYPLFFKHLNSYPRNLRIAVAEALILDNVSKYKIEALIDLVEQNKKGLKFIAKFVGDIIGRSVKLPVMYYKAEEFSKLEKKFSYRVSKALTPIFKIASIFIVLTFLSFYFLVDVMFFYIVSDRKYKEGIVYIYENKRELAKATFKDAYYMRPNKKWFLTYARAFDDIRDFDSAEEKYEELFTVDPFSVDASKRRRKNFDRDGYISYASMKMRLGEYADANSILDEVISYSVYDYEALMAKGDNYFQWAQTDPTYYKDSINSYTILLSKYGRKKEILFKLFNVYIEAGADRESENVNAFIKANAELDIDEVVYTKYAKKLIDRYVEFKVYHKRINALSRNLKYFSAQINLLNKEFSSFKTGNGKGIYNSLNDINLNSEIEYILRRILIKNPDYNKALFESGRYFYYMGDFKKSEGYLLTALNSFRQEDLIENFSEKIIAYRILSDIYEMENDVLKASNIMSLALNEYDFYKRNGLIKVSRELALLYEKQGDILRTLNGFKSAISSYKMAINEGVNSPDVYYKLALLNYKDNNYKDALACLFKVENISGFANNDKVLNSIASVLYKMGDFEASRSYYLRVLQNLESEKSSILSFKPKENDYHRDLLIRKIEICNNLGVVEIRASLGDRVGASVIKDNRLFDSGVANLTESSRIFDLLNRDDMVKTAKKDLASLNLRNIFKNNFISSKTLFYDNLSDNL
ncbi:hypothetical protein BmHG_00332 [Borrelia miyamotoi]|uniref:Tetratricopeptide repeat protein n=1 Tax=Borrelia miyamotoi TaxID=47466 RepID=A0AAP8YS70_9SPIR|nr:tetratricopeptide repeat protein [Borrelia miyamotoi]AHH05087.1 Putative membrane associated protein [Borrelia miyamotoi FR64b]ATQ14882.1 tetratricopeptide repeat protein [Borrelia miyamotoi]ATQ16064.1 tetratricopeptide repeat protein [Borrelia miyamotoi]ATQ17210.1 tetratricopeptide repeat protein [Borrelia miyamotoi]ATQ18284.1 tetratricopeptide repeat protein [Borrelia miyamotoi]